MKSATNKIAQLLLAGALAAAFTNTALAQDKAAAKPVGKGVVEAGRYTATVESVDQATRAVTLKAANGDLVSFIASDEVKNLAQVNKGDIVTLEYAAAVMVKLEKSASSVRERTVTEAKQSAPLGQKPAGVKVNEVSVVASVENIDTKKNIVTLRGPQHTVDLKVQDPAMLKGVKKGDFVKAVYTEAIAIKVEAAPKKDAPKPAAPKK